MLKALYRDRGLRFQPRLRSRNLRLGTIRPAHRGASSETQQGRPTATDSRSRRRSSPGVARISVARQHTLFERGAVPL